MGKVMIINASPRAPKSNSKQDAQLFSEYCRLDTESVSYTQLINCQGCRVEGIKTVFCDSMCRIRQCALKKGVDTCGDCSGLENCPTVGAILEDNPSALKNLKE